MPFENLPAVVALEALPVLTGTRRSASIQLSEKYLENRIAVLSALDIDPTSERIDALRRSRRLLDTEVSIESFDADAFLEAMNELRETYRRIPEVTFLQENYPGTCIVVPELVRNRNKIEFGARIYFHPEDHAPKPREIVRRNVTAIVNDDEHAFDRYKGRIHGYPECCIASFAERNSESPERRSVASLETQVRADSIGTDANVSIEDILPDFFATPAAYSFFSRQFYPEPQCHAAQSRGEEIYEELSNELSEVVARDHFRLNYALCYTVTASLGRGNGELPAVGALGTEHIYHYLPLKNALSIPRYNDESPE
ncbi:hypothetical protein [Halomicrococcus sp. NG-SE-24]|uniref:hypothetical protein n=1 Tax=Halomicrococcus sp. NG-SE-24 TaxID=3436928 RepID=UPI003D964116